MRVFWDTNLFIYYFEDYASLSTMARELRLRMGVRGDGLFSSVLTLGELLVGPRPANPLAVDEMRQRLMRSATLIPFDLAAAEQFAVIRSDRGIKAPDAIQLACAAVGGCDLFVTNDERLSRRIVPGVSIISSLRNVPI